MRSLKYITLILLLALGHAIGSAQGIRIYQKDKGVITIPYTQLESVVNIPTDEVQGFVDLGLSVKWATCNLGANSPVESGDFFAWGEVSTKSFFSVDNSLTFDHSIVDISGNSQYDAATVLMGDSARIPTKAEYEELLSRCKITWFTQDGVTGLLAKGPNGNTIFFPAAGHVEESTVITPGEYGFYWSSTPATDFGASAGALRFNRDEWGCNWYLRFIGSNIRPVKD